MYKLIKKNCCNLAVNNKIVLQAVLRAETTYLQCFFHVQAHITLPCSKNDSLTGWNICSSSKKLQGENVLVQICGKPNLPEVISFISPSLHKWIHPDIPTCHSTDPMAHRWPPNPLPPSPSSVLGRFSLQHCRSITIRVFPRGNRVNMWLIIHPFPFIHIACGPLPDCSCFVGKLLPKSD